MKNLLKKIWNLIINVPKAPHIGVRVKTTSSGDNRQNLLQKLVVKPNHTL